MRLAIGNWKMHTTLDEARALAAGIAAGLKAGEGPSDEGFGMGVAPPFPFLAAVGEALAGSGVELVAQDCHAEAKGAFTSAVSVAQLASVGVDRVLVGHSERRKHFGDDDAICARKLRAVLAGGLKAVLCVGENLAQRDAGEHVAVVSAQVKASLEGLETYDPARLAVAYEPVWAIGTGRTATPEQAGDMHAAIEGVLAELGAAGVPVLYGGSVKPANVASLASTPGVSGVLVGGASLQADSFLAICQGVREQGQNEPEASGN